MTFPWLLTTTWFMMMTFKNIGRGILCTLPRECLELMQYSERSYEKGPRGKQSYTSSRGKRWRWCMEQECTFRPHPETSSSKYKISLTLLPCCILFRLDLSILNNTFTAEIFEMLISLEEILLERDSLTILSGAGGASRGRRPGYGEWGVGVQVEASLHSDSKKKGGG